MTKLLVIAALALAAMVNAMAEETPTPTRQSIILGGGCFWCVESCFEEVPGVIEAVSGYAGGAVDRPSYELICDGDTGHAEVVEVIYDPAKVDLPKLLSIFFHVHDPTTRNRQGADSGTQYRSIILCTDETQRSAATAAIATAQARFSSPIVTEVVILATTGPARFHRAEDYHQDYFKLHPDQAYCKATIPGKLTKLRKLLDKKD